jgi:hypothetical protein
MWETRSDKRFRPACFSTWAIRAGIIPTSAADKGSPVQIDFRSSERSSLGVEMELEIVDLGTRELRSGASEVLPLLGRDHPNGEHPAELAPLMAERDLGLMCSGTHLFSDEVTTMAAMSQCLVDRLDTLLDRGYTLPVPRSWIIRENRWRAARYGLDAEIILDDQGRLQPVGSRSRSSSRSWPRSPAGSAAATSRATRSPSWSVVQATSDSVRLLPRGAP